MAMEYWAWCNYTDCEKKNTCKRYSEEDGINYVKFENIDKSVFDCYLEKKLEVVKTEENDSSMKEGD